MGFKYSSLQTNQKQRQCLTVFTSHQRLLYLLLQAHQTQGAHSVSTTHTHTQCEILISLWRTSATTQWHVEDAGLHYSYYTCCICRHTRPGKQDTAPSHRKPSCKHSCFSATGSRCQRAPAAVPSLRGRQDRGEGCWSGCSLKQKRATGNYCLQMHPHFHSQVPGSSRQKTDTQSALLPSAPLWELNS